MRHLFLFSLVILTSITLFAQTGDDGFNNIEIDHYRKETEVARESIRLLPGFNTTGHDNFHAYIDPNLPFNGGNPVSDGEFSHSFIRTFKPVKDHKTTDTPVHESLQYDNWNEDITYYDGLGRPIQETRVKASPSGADMIRPIKYDEVGNVTKEYLEYAITQTSNAGPGGYRPNPIPEIKTFYRTFYGDNDGNYPYHEKEFDHSPLNRVTKKSAPGAEYNLASGNVKEYEYKINTNANVYKLSINQNDLEVEGVYDSRQLYKNVKVDENDIPTIKYKNKTDSVILKKKNDGNGWLETYYVYDDYGRLRYVIPPEAVNHLSSGGTYDNNTSWIKNYCYYYEYDGKGRTIKKSLPGAETVYLVYDKRDQLVLTQDGNLRENNQWNFTKYDPAGRPVLTGIYKHNESLNQSQMTSEVEQNGHFYEHFSINNNNYGGYTNQSFPVLNQDNHVIHTITYYDNYKCLEHPDYSDVYFFRSYELDFNYEKTERTHGKVTAKVTNVLEHNNIEMTDEHLLRVRYYDKYGRLIQSVRDNHKGGLDIVSKNRDFSNNLLTEQTKHKLTPDDSITIKKDYQYDNRKRLISTSIKVEDNEPVVLHHNTYDELGQLAVKKLHSNTEGNDALQSLNYSYNMRGWMKKINDPVNLGNDFFGMELHYAEGTNPTYHNGNISSMKWKSKNFNSPKTYNFTYDGANRLTKAKYGLGDRYNVNLEYSKNGNIQLLERNGKLGESSDYGPIDILDYSYMGNLLVTVDDNEGFDYQTNGFTDNNSFQNKEYFYDANGNLTRDDNKQIADICYTYNNLPERIKLTQNRQNIINYVYDAAGNKIYKKTLADRAEIQTTDYIGNFVYKQGELAYILHKEGRIVSQGDGEWEYQYFLSDHLGNTRIAFNDKNKILQDKSYYPFGMQIDGLSVAGDFTPDNKYLYNGKEMQDDFELDWYDYGARMYDVQLGRWHVTDAMAEKAPAWTPYRYGFNNPISVNDPNGNLERHQIIDPHLDDNYYSSVTVTGIGGTGKTTIAADASTSRENDNNEGDDDSKNKNEEDPLLDVKIDLFFGLTYNRSVSLLGFQSFTNISPLRINWLSFNWNTNEGASLIPYDGIYSEVKASVTPLASASIKREHYSKDVTVNARFSTLRISNNNPARYSIFHLSQSLIFGGIEIDATMSSEKVNSSRGQYMKEHVEKTGFMPLRGR